MTFNGISEIDRLLTEIEIDVRETRDLTGVASFDRRVIEALRSVPRHAFVPGWLQDQAYLNRPLPIGCGQTISQPYIVALMTDLIAPAATDIVLEIGTGSGYQAAVLAHLVAQVYSLEIVEELAQSARRRLHDLGYGNVEVGVGDGNSGWAEHAPFDAIVVTAAAPRIPDALIEQLKPGGALVIPVAKSVLGQELQVVRKDAAGRLRVKDVLPVRFVPFVGVVGK